MVKLTRDAHLIPTGGSDYHGYYKEDVSLGVGHAGDLRVPDEILEELKAASLGHRGQRLFERAGDGACDDAHREVDGRRCEDGRRRRVRARPAARRPTRSALKAPTSLVAMRSGPGTR
jgi:hypothetical protein